MSRRFAINDKKSISDFLILFDGYWGSGKSLFFSLIDDQKFFLKSIIDESIEHSLALNLLNELSDSGLKAIIDQRKDLLIFNNQISRNTNIRLSDDTGPRNYYEFFKIIVKSFRSYKSNLISKEIITEKINLPIMIHCSIGSLKKIYEIYKEKLYYSHSSRNPIDVYDHTLEYYQNLYHCPSLFDILLSTDKENFLIPWFLKSIDKNLYDLIGSSLEALALLSISSYTRITAANKIKFSKYKNINFIDFDSIISSPKTFISHFNSYLCPKKSIRQIKFNKYNLPRDTYQIKLQRAHTLDKIKKLDINKEILDYFFDSIEIYKKAFS